MKEPFSDCQEALRRDKKGAGSTLRKEPLTRRCLSRESYLRTSRPHLSPDEHLDRDLNGRRINRLTETKENGGRCATPKGRRPKQAKNRFGSFAALLTALLATSAPLTAPAQGAEVFSGEHPNSSRLVLRFDRPTQVSATRVEEGYRVDFDPQASTLDLSNVFDLIPRDRISGIRQDADDGSLLILSSCDCVLETFDAGRFTYALDLRDRRSGERLEAREVRTEASFGTESGGTMEDGNTLRRTNETPRSSVSGLAKMDDGGILPAELISSAARRLNGRVLPESKVLPFPILQIPPASSFPEEAGQRNVVSDPSESAVASSSRRSGPESSRTATATDNAHPLSENLRRAADAGLLQLRDERGDRNRIWNAERSAGYPFRDIEAASNRLSTLSGNLSINLGSGGTPNSGGQKSSTDACPPVDRFAFLSLDSRADAFSALRDLRRDLVTEAGELDPDVALAMTERYLSLGFGAEAAHLLNMARVSPGQASAYASLARIVDTTSDVAPDVWEGKEGCSSEVALWALLGQDGRVPPNSVDESAVQRAFFALNAPMRLHLGPVLASHLDALGHADAADAIRTNIEPLQTASSARGAVTADGSTRTGPVASPSASARAVSELLARAQSAMRAGRPIGQDDLGLAEALAWEYRGTREGVKLAGMTALGRLVDNDVPGAMAILEDQWKQADPTWTATLTEAFAETVVAKGDAELLELVLHPRGGEVTALLDGSQRISVADRLTDVGFPDLALELMREVDEPAAELRRALAAAHSAAGDPARALALVAGLPGKQAAAVRAEALEALEQYALAAGAYADAEDEQGAARAAWLSGDTDTISMHGTARHRELATRLSRADPPETPPVTDDAPPSLGAGQALIERSAGLRTDISALLDTFSD